jgi:hypothetical protein
VSKAISNGGLIYLKLVKNDTVPAAYTLQRMTHRANSFATMTRRPKYGARKPLPHSFSLVGEEMGGAEPSRVPPWGCSRCGGAPPLGSHGRCLAEAEADGPQASSRPPFATPRALPHATSTPHCPSSSISPPPRAAALKEAAVTPNAPPHAAASEPRSAASLQAPS